VGGGVFLGGGGVPRCVTKCDRGKGVSKLVKNSVPYFLYGRPHSHFPLFHAKTYPCLVDACCMHRYTHIHTHTHTCLVAYVLFTCDISSFNYT